MAKASTAIPPDKLALYERLVATHPEIERKGATMPYTSRNGQMFSFLTKEGTLALRLPDDARADFITKYATRLCEQHGVVMKEYVVVPDALLKNTKTLGRYFAASWDYVGSLAAKPTTKPKPTQKPTKKHARKTSR